MLHAPGRTEVHVREEPSTSSIAASSPPSPSVQGRKSVGREAGQQAGVQQEVRAPPSQRTRSSSKKRSSISHSGRSEKQSTAVDPRRGASHRKGVAKRVPQLEADPPGAGKRFKADSAEPVDLSSLTDEEAASLDDGKPQGTSEEVVSIGHSEGEPDSALAPPKPRQLTRLAHCNGRQSLVSRNEINAEGSTSSDQR